MFFAESARNAPEAVTHPPALGSATASPTGLLSSLSNRLVLWILSVSYSIVIIASTAFYIVATREIESTEIQVLSQRTDTIRNWMDSDTIDEASLYHEVTENNLAPREILMRVIDPRRNIYIETPDMDALVPQSLLPVADDLQMDERRVGVVRNSHGNTYKTLVARLSIGTAEDSYWVYIQAAVNTSIDENAEAWFRQLFVIVIIGGFVLCLSVAVYVTRRELAPLRQITEASRRINSRTLNERIALDTLPQELFQLGNEFNLMLDRLQTAYLGLRHYADNVAHELRGPVNRMLLEGEVALNRQDDNAGTCRAALQANNDEARHLAKIVDNLLFLARTDNAGYTLDRVAVDLRDIIAKVTDFFEASAEEKGVTLLSDCRGRVVVNGDRDLLVRALYNLVANSLDHTPQGGTIHVMAVEDQGKITLTVNDNGQGIDQLLLPYVFDRFFRADKARTAGPRIGLGLAITRSIVLLHGGDIQIESQIGQGTTTTLSFVPD